MATLQSRSSNNSRNTLIHSQLSPVQEVSKSRKKFDDVINEEEHENEELKEGGQQDETPQGPTNEKDAKK